MTEDEHIKMVEVGNEFWHEFSKLCALYLAKAPPHLHHEYKDYLADHTSFYGRKQEQ